MRTNIIKLALFIVAFMPVGLFAQNKFTDEDLRNYPHWFDLMQKENPNFFEVKRAYDLYFEKHEKVKGNFYSHLYDPPGRKHIRQHHQQKQIKQHLI